MAWKLNGARIENNPRKLPATVLEMLPDFKFWSVEALQELYHGIIELSLEMAKQERRDRKGGERATITRCINQINQSKYKIPNNRGKLLEALYEKILVAKGCGRLHGFGFTNKWGDALKGNSEYEFITIISKQQSKMEEQSKMEGSIMKRSELVKAAKELNETLGLEPQIDIKEKPKVLIALIKEAAELVDPELDDLTDSTLSVIAKITKDEKTTEEKETKEKEEISEKEESKESKEATKTMKDVKKKVETETKGKKKGEMPNLSSLIKRINSRGDDKLTYILDKMVVKGATRQEMYDTVSAIALERGLKAFTSGVKDIDVFLKYREKAGWIFKNVEDTIKLEGWNTNE